MKIIPQMVARQVSQETRWTKASSHQVKISPRMVARQVSQATHWAKASSQQVKITPQVVARHMSQATRQLVKYSADGGKGFVTGNPLDKSDAASR